MFKTQLSSDLIPEKVFFALIPITVFLFWAAVPVALAVAVFLLLLIFVPYSIYTIYMAPFNLSYDGSLLFITSRKTEKIIPLKNVKSIRSASGSLALRKRWEISYVENSVEESVFFYPKDGQIVPFSMAVRARNPGMDSDFNY